MSANTGVAPTSRMTLAGATQAALKRQKGLLAEVHDLDEDGGARGGHDADDDRQQHHPQHGRPLVVRGHRSLAHPLPLVDRCERTLRGRTPDAGHWATSIRTR